jgi:hypothetical protein
MPVVGETNSTNTVPRWEYVLCPEVFCGISFITALEHDDIDLGIRHHLFTEIEHTLIRIVQPTPLIYSERDDTSVCRINTQTRESYTALAMIDRATDITPDSRSFFRDYEYVRLMPRVR